MGARSACDDLLAVIVSAISPIKSEQRDAEDSKSPIAKLKDETSMSTKPERFRINDQSETDSACSTDQAADETRS